MTFTKFINGEMYEVDLDVMVDIRSNSRLVIWLVGEMTNCASGELSEFRHMLDFKNTSLIHAYHWPNSSKVYNILSPIMLMEEQLNYAFHYACKLNWPLLESQPSNREIKVYA